MKIESKKLICPVCGEESDFDVVLSWSCFNPGLDGNPYSNIAALSLQECPKCHYVSLHLPEPPDQKIIDYIHSDEYQKIISENDDQNIRKLKAYIGIKNCQDDKKDIANAYAQLSWLTGEQNPDLAKQYMLKSIEYMDKFSESEAAAKNPFTPDETLCLIDKLRQCNMFEEALMLTSVLDDWFQKAAPELECDIRDLEDYRILMAEIQYIKKQDRAPHRLNEVIK